MPRPRKTLRLEVLESREVPTANVFALPGLNEVAGLDVLSGGTVQVVGYATPTQANSFGAGLFQELSPTGTPVRTATLTGSAGNLRPDQTLPEAVNGGRVVGEEAYYDTGHPNSFYANGLIWDASAPAAPFAVQSYKSAHGGITDINRNGTYVGWVTNDSDTLDQTARVGTFGGGWTALDGPWYDPLPDTTRRVSPVATAISDDDTVVITSGQGEPLHSGLNPPDTSVQSWAYNLDTHATVLLTNPAVVPGTDFTWASSISPNGRFGGGGVGVFDAAGTEDVLYQPVLYSGPGRQQADLLTLPDGRPFFSQGNVTFGVPPRVLVADDGMLFTDHWGDNLAWVKAPARPVMTLTDYLQTTYHLDTGLVFERVTDVVTRNGLDYIAVNTDQGGRVLVIDSVGANHAPTVVTLTSAVNEDQPLALGLLSGAADADGDRLSVAAVSTPAHGTVVWAADGTATYRPAADYNGPDGFDYTATDGTASVVGHVAITVLPVNDPPVAVADAARTQRGQAVAGNVLANDSDVDGDTLTVLAHTAPANGRVVVSPTGAFTYTPQAGFVGTDAFSYSVGDGHGGTANATVTVTVTPANRAPVAGFDVVVDRGGALLTFAPLRNDRDPDGDALTIMGLSTPASGRVGLTADGQVTYTPRVGYVGIDTFTYTVSDGRGGTATGRVFVLVLPGRPAAAPASRNDPVEVPGMDVVRWLDDLLAGAAPTAAKRG